METGSAYKSYVNSMQNYQTTQGRKDYQAPYAQKFEDIYDKAKDQDIKLSNAKEFLNELSESELQTLQKYTGLVDKIDVDSLSAEGAYNLLMHDYEKYDFNADGVAEVGKGKNILPVPINMPKEVRDAYISAMNSLGDKDKLMAMTLSLDPARVKARLNNETYTPTKIDYNFLKEQVQSRLNPTGGAYTSEEAKKVYSAFWDAFESSFSKDPTHEPEEKRSDEVASFLKDLREKGAVKFLAEFNQEKIEKMVEEYRQKLIEEMGDSPEAMERIEKLVDNFRKKLLEELHEQTQQEAKNKGLNKPISSNSIVQELIDLQLKAQKKPFEEMLKV